MAEKYGTSIARKKSAKGSNSKIKMINDAEKSTTSPAIHDMLGAKLKAYYGQIIGEPIPDRLKSLMAELEAQCDIKKPVEPDAENGGDI